MRKTFKQIMSIMLVAALALGGTPFTAKASIDIKQEENNKNKKDDDEKDICKSLNLKLMVSC